MGRSSECQEILRLRESAESGRGAARVLTGAPGVGKTELLRWAADHPGTALVVGVEALERDRDRPLALQRAIVASLRAALPEIAPREADPALDDGEALFSLLADAAPVQALLLVVDGTEWADERSREALVFAARRLERESVLLLMAERACDAHGFAGRLPEIEIAGLSPLDGAVLLSGEVDTRVAEELVHQTRGNPLALLEIATRLSPEQRRGETPLGPVLPIGDGVRRAFLARTASLGPTEVRALLIASTDSHLDRQALLCAARGWGIDAEAVARVVVPGLLHVERSGTLGFAHPLLRAAVYQSAQVVDRRAAHRMVAALVDTDIERRARHLAAAADGPDEHTSDVLADAARSLDDSCAAGQLWHRAAVLTPDRTVRYERLLAAGSALALADEHLSAVHAFDEALAIVDGDMGRTADVVVRRTVHAVESLGTRGIRGQLDELTARLDPSDPRVRVLVALSGSIALLEGDVVGARDVMGSVVLAGPGPPQMMLAVARMLTGEILAAGDVVAYAQDVVASGAARVRHDEFVVCALTLAGEHSAASRLVDALVTVRRSTGARVELAFALTARAYLYHRTGHWGAAHVDVVEAVELATATSRPTTLARSLFVLARIEAGLGDTAAAIEHARASYDLSERFELGSFSWHAAAAMGFALLSEGHSAEAIEWLERARGFERARKVRLLATSLAAPDLVEAYVRCGQKEAAARLVEELASEHPGQQGALGEALFLRCRALGTATDATCDFEASLQRFAEVQAPFEEARTRLCFGERARRDRDVATAHRNLTAAAEVFADLGARGWERRARIEAAACSPGHASASRPRPFDLLTAQEYQVAIAVANGATSREAAAALFLSPRTVEYHLGKIYRKLGLRSRSDLARRIAADPDLVVEGDPRR